MKFDRKVIIQIRYIVWSSVVAALTDSAVLDIYDMHIAHPEVPSPDTLDNWPIWNLLDLADMITETADQYCKKYRGLNGIN